jgi:hypothetical protein
MTTNKSLNFRPLTSDEREIFGNAQNFLDGSAPMIAETGTRLIVIAFNGVAVATENKTYCIAKRGNKAKQMKLAAYCATADEDTLNRASAH